MNVGTENLHNYTIDERINRNKRIEITYLRDTYRPFVKTQQIKLKMYPTDPLPCRDDHECTWISDETEENERHIHREWGSKEASPRALHKWDPGVSDQAVMSEIIRDDVRKLLLDLDLNNTVIKKCIL